MVGMRALQVDTITEDLSGVVLREVARPRAGASEVLIRVEAASLNYPDLLMTRGQYQMKPQVPFTIGGDVAGEIVQLGSGVEGLELGQRVWGVGLGCFADYVALPAISVAPLPDQFDGPSGAAFGAAYLTAYVALVERAHMSQGEWVLVHGAAGGMGLAAVDLARALGGKVIATSTSDAKLAVINELYAPDKVLNLSGGFREAVLDITGGGVDVIFDPVNGDTFDESVRSIAFNGRLLVVGFTSGEQRSLRSNIAMIKGFSLMGVRAGEYGRRFPERRRAIGDALGRLARDGAIRPHVDSIHLLGDWRAAFTRMQDRSAVGKIILSLG